MLVDGIYPPYSRFVSTIDTPILAWEKKYAKWQEACRKDIERAFGVLQNKFQWTQRPIMELKLDVISDQMKTCLILHNMCVCDRIMDGDLSAIYRADNQLDGEPEAPTAVPQPADLAEVQGSVGKPNAVRLAHLSPDERALIVQREAWKALVDKDEHIRLQRAIVKAKTGQDIE